MADEKAVRRPRGTPIDRGIALMRQMDLEELQDYAGVVRGFVAGRLADRVVLAERTRPAYSNAMLELGERAAEGDE